MATNMSLHNQTVFDPRTGTQKTLYESISRDWLWCLPVSETKTLILKRIRRISLYYQRQYMMIQQRPQDWRAGWLLKLPSMKVPIQWKIKSISLKTKGVCTPDLYKTVQRVAKKINLHTSKVTFLAFGVDTEYSMVEYFRLCTTHLPRKK